MPTKSKAPARTRKRAPTAIPTASPTRKPRAKRDADTTRERILQTAIREFAANGYSGARVEIIVKKARVNPRMVYHYFGDKDRLYVAVLERVLGELREHELKLEVDHIDPLEGMKQLFAFVHGHFATHPELIPLLSGENLLRASFLRRSTKAPIVASPLIELVARLLERGTKQGVFRSGIDPLQLYVAMVALSYFHRSNAYTLSTLFRTDLLDERWQAEQRNVAEQMLTRFLLRTPPHE
jgi:AcrR family transcriptional regulator